MLFSQDVALALYLIAILVAVFYAIMASMPALFAEVNHYNQLQTGLCFIPLGVGAAIGSIVNGKTQDWNFRRLAKKHNIPYDKRKDMDLRRFPIEHCRIMPIIPEMTIASLVCITYGFGMQYGAPVAVPLVQQFLMSMFLTGTGNSLSTLNIDRFPKQSATITSSSNLFRCIFSAILAS